eukprot:9478737-Pyramimonas_sp.AAC.1
MVPFREVAVGNAVQAPHDDFHYAVDRASAAAAAAAQVALANGCDQMALLRNAVGPIKGCETVLLGVRDAIA